MPTVLLVEDYADDRQMYAEYLRGRGYHVVAVADPAVAAALAHTADVVVTDLRLAGPMDGLALIRDVRSGARTGATPIIVLTASATYSTQLQAEAAGCSLFLTKPCLPESLEGAVARGTSDNWRAVSMPDGQRDAVRSRTQSPPLGSLVVGYGLEFTAGYHCSLITLYPSLR
jgi:CheY-like chemotaxis protein